MNTLYKGFLKKEDGAVTVDWVVLTAAVVAFSVGIALIFVNATTDLSDGIWTFMDKFTNY